MLKLQDKCGVFGVYLDPTSSDGAGNAATLSYYGLCSLQHRGQEAAGIAVVDSTAHSPITVKKGLGLVSEVFNKDALSSMHGNIAIAHTRYATAGARTIENAQPILNKFKKGTIAICHNGQLVNYAPLQSMLEETGATFTSNSDTEVILKMIAREYTLNSSNIEQSVMAAIKAISGSYALCIATEDTLIGARDPFGIRPLVLGKVNGGFVLASESCALDAVGASVVRDISPGEIVIINQNGVRSSSIISKQQPSLKQTCIFEYVYFARPDSVIDNISVQKARQAMGAVLARENPINADIVMGVPDSGLGAALGYSQQSGVPYSMGIIKNKYIGRTFIAPTQTERENLVYVKLNAVQSELQGKSIIVIDDSIVRGTTSKRLVQLLRRAGAKEVHFLVSSPPVKFPCHLGIDTPTKGELISSNHAIAEICQEIGSDSLAFITLGGMIEALQSCGTNIIDGFCKGCFSGTYPV